MLSAPSETAPSSKRRKVQNLWSKIFDNVNITDEQLKEDFVTRFTNSFTPAEFLKALDNLCKTFCIGCRIEGWEDENRQTISSLQTGIPSPSNMKWEDQSCVLVGSIPKFKNIDNLPHVMILRKRT